MQLLDVAGIGFFARMTFSYYGGTKPVPQVFRKFVELRVAVNLDGLLGGIANHVAVVAPGEMIFQFGLCAVVDDAVEVIGQLLQKFRALHWLPSPLAFFSCLAIFHFRFPPRVSERNG